MAAETLAIQHRESPKGWDAEIPSFPADAKGIASRDSSGKVLNAIAKHHPWLIGGSADLSPSTKTRLTFEGAGDISRDCLGARNIHFGVREHAMGAILNGAGTHQTEGIRLRLLDFQRLRQRFAAALRHHGASRDLHLYPRFDRGGRRWSHPSTRGTSCLAARHSRLGRYPSLRCQRGR